jgi:hypothetical protein
MRHEVRVGDQHARRIGVGADDGDRLARLHDQRLVRFEVLQRGDDAVEILPGPGGAADAAIDHQLMRVFGHVGVQVVHQHPHRGLGLPALGGDFGAGRRVDVAGVVAGVRHGSGSFFGGPRGRFAPRTPRGYLETDDQARSGKVCRWPSTARLRRPARRRGQGRGRGSGRPPARDLGAQRGTAPAAGRRWQRRAEFDALRGAHRLDAKDDVQVLRPSPSRRAPWAAMLTWSSWLALVGVLSITVGWRGACSRSSGRRW